MALQQGRDHEEFRWLAALFAMTVATVGAAYWMGAAVGVPVGSVLFGYATILWLMIPPIVVIAMLPWGVRALLLRAEKPWDDFKPFMSERFGSPALTCATVGPILLMPMLIGAFGCLKQIMPLTHPFAWDDKFAELDRLLFFGSQPWQWSHAVFGSPTATLVIDRIYSGWVALLFVAVLAASTVAPRHTRARFFLSFALGWLLIGIVGAFAFASAGPCYADATGALAAADFAPLMERLNAIHDGGTVLNAIDWQEQLWRAHVAREYGFARGVSAMPSMHNTIAFLYVLTLRNASLLTRALGWAFAVAILIGSVHLGWHYLVDGLFAWVAMAAVWWAAGAFLKSVGYKQIVNKGEANEAPSLEPVGVPAAA